MTSNPDRPLLTSRAEVSTPTPERYAKQLVAHLGRRVRVEDTPDGAVLTFGSGLGTVQAGAGVLTLTAQAVDAAALAEVQDVLGRHLERFGSRQELVVAWSPAI